MTKTWTAKITHINSLELIAYLLKNTKLESSLLYPDPNPYVFLEPLCDFIREKIGISKEEFNELADDIEQVSNDS